MMEPQPKKQLGRPPREGSDMPPRIQHALILRAGGMSWIKAAEQAGVCISSLHSWKSTPAARDFLNAEIKESLSLAHSKLMATAPAVADELLNVAMDRSEKGYVRVQAAEAVFRVIQNGVIDTEMRAQLGSIRQQLAALEQGQVIDV
jgi:hypothetical protein